MPELVEKASPWDHSPRPVRVMETPHPGAERVLVEHLHYACLADAAELIPRPSTGMVLCGCGSAGWLPRNP